MELWRIHLNPDVKRPDLNAHQFCIENNILGFGWPIHEFHEGEIDEDTYFKVGDKVFREERGDNGWLPAANALLKNMSIGDLCWAREGDEYYIGRVVGNWQYCRDQINIDHDIVNVRSCEWKAAGNVDLFVPETVRVALDQQATLQRIEHDATMHYSNILYSCLMMKESLKY